MVKETEHGELIIVSAQGEEIAGHQRVSGRNQRVIVPAHYQALGVTSRPVQRSGAVQVLREPTELHLAAPDVEARPLAVYDQLAGVTP
jgi:hypothetical protein